MLAKLRAMGVFACVVENGSFSGAAKVLGITTSAVSQQVRSLENDLNVKLLYRSTRKIHLTEAGQVFFKCCQEMITVANLGKLQICELQDKLAGELSIATTPEFGALQIVPALTQWMKAHQTLQVRIEASNQYIDLAERGIDIAIRMSSKIEEQENYEYIPIMQVKQVLLAAPHYFNQHSQINHPLDLLDHYLLPVDLMKDYSKLKLTHQETGEKIDIEMPVQVRTNNVLVMKSLCLHGHGIARILHFDAQQELRQTDLVEVLPDWKLPDFILYAVVLKREEQPTKITRCIETLKTFFN